MIQVSVEHIRYSYAQCNVEAPNHIYIYSTSIDKRTKLNNLITKAASSLAVSRCHRFGFLFSVCAHDGRPVRDATDFILVDLRDKSVFSSSSSSMSSMSSTSLLFIISSVHYIKALTQIVTELINCTVNGF